MMGHLVLGRNDGGVHASAAKGWMWRMWQQLFARKLARGR